MTMQRPVPVAGDLWVCGIDPGKTGGVALLGPGAAYYDCWDLPWVGKDVDLQWLDMLLAPVNPRASESGGWRLHVAIELQQAFLKQGAVSAGTLMYGYGQLTGFCLGAKIPFSTPRPVEWKDGLNIPSGRGKKPSEIKAMDKEFARRFFPEADLGTRADQGRSDALLIAERVRRQLIGA